MNKLDTNDSPFFLLWFIVFFVSYVILKFSFGILICDDAYITLSHVKTWLESGRMIVSLNNPVNATSTPLYTLLLAIISSVFGKSNIIYIAYGIQTIFEIGSMVMVFVLVEKLVASKLFAMAAVSALGLSVGMYAMSAYGMETMLYIFLILSLHYLALFRPEKKVLLCVAIACTTLVRPEGGLAVISVLIIRYVSKEKIRFLVLYSFVAACALLLLFSFYQYS